MFKICLENRIIHKNNNYKCCLCSYTTTENNFNLVLCHIEIVQHKQRLKKIDENLKSKEAKIFSKFSESQQRMIVENHIACNNKTPLSFYCHTCKCSICGIFNIFEHIQGALHKNALKDTITTKQVKANNKTITNNAVPKVNNLSNSAHFPSSKVLTETSHCILIDEKLKLYTCNLCKTKISGESNVLQHSQGYLHQSKLTLNTSNKEVKNNDTKATKQNIPVLNDFIKIYHCSSCKNYIKKDVMCHYMFHLNKKLNSLPENDIIKFNITKDGKPIVKCLLCSKWISSDKDLNKHIVSMSHLNHLDFLLYASAYIELTSKENSLKNYDSWITNLKLTNIFDALLCTLCNVPFLEKNKNNHIKGVQHQNMIKDLESKCGEKEKKSTRKTEDPETVDFYRCFLCQKSFCDVSELFKHYCNISHKRKFECFKKINFNQLHFVCTEKKNYFKCYLCDKKYLNNNKEAIEHILSKMHKKKLSNNKTVKSANVNKDDISSKISITKVNKEIKKCNEFKTSPEELIQLGFDDNIAHSTTSSKSDSAEMDDLLNDLVTLDLSKKQQQKLPPIVKKMNSHAPNKQRKKKSYHTSVLLNGRSLIKHCIASGKDNIYNIDHEKINLMKLGMSIIFPWNNEWICYPCGLEFPKTKELLFEHLQNDKHIECIHKMIDIDKEFENSPEEFSDLKLAKLYMHEDSDEWVQCYACDTKVKNENSNIHIHSVTFSHLEKSKIWQELLNEIYQEFLNIFEDMWYYAQGFICEICNIKFKYEIDFAAHLESQKHLNNIKNLKLDTAVKFSICPVCTTYLYGKSNTYSLHCENTFHKVLIKSGDFMISNMPPIALDFLNDIDKKISLLIQNSNEVILQNQKVLDLLETVEETAKYTYPNAKAYIFGSRLSHLGFCDSDVDIYLDCENKYIESTTQNQCQKYLLLVQEHFDLKSNIWVREESVLETRIPIMKLQHISTGLKCDISFTNGLSVEKSKLIRYYTTAYPICRQLILYLKKWLNFCQISGSFGITTFAITWFVISYLQIKGIFPSVYDLIKQKNQSKIVGGWECGFPENITASDSDLNFQDNLKEFFSYYAHFNYKTNVICPFLGRIVEKRIFAYTDQLPKSMKIYKLRVKEDNSLIFRYDSPMCIQDPIDLSQNITKGVSKHQLRCFRQYCAESASKMLEHENS